MQLAQIRHLNMLLHVRLELVNHRNRCGHNRAVVDVNDDDDETTIRGALEEDSLVDIASGEPEIANNDLN